VQISLTKKVADILGLKPEAADVNYDPLYSWTANYIQTWSNRKENTLVVMNNATCFCICIYHVKESQLKKLDMLFIDAIRHTMEKHGYNSAVIDDYINNMGKWTYTKNSDRYITSRLNRRGLELAIIICSEFADKPYDIFDDTIGYHENQYLCSNGSDDYIYPEEEFNKLISSRFNHTDK